MNPEEKKINPFTAELSKFLGKEVIVQDFNGKEFEGKVKSINFAYGTVIIVTPKEKIYVRNVSNIRRKRDNPEEVKKKK